SPSSIVGLQTLWFISPGVENDRSMVFSENPIELELSIDGMSSLIARQPIPVPGVPLQYDIKAAEIPEDVSWYGRSEGVVGPSLKTQDDQVHIQMWVPSSTLLSRTISISQGSFPFIADLPVVANQALLTQLGLNVDDRAAVEINNTVFTVHFVGSVPLMPGGSPRNPTIIANYDDLQVVLMQTGAPSPGVTSWWTEVPQENTERYLDTLPAEAVTSTRLDTIHNLQDDPLRVGIQAALWLVTAAAIVLAALGFAVHTVVTVRARELEFAQLRAVGLARNALTRLVSAESLLLAMLGTFFGLILGVALGYLVAPLISVGPDGRPPVPGVAVDIPWDAIGLLAAEIAAVLAVVVFLVSLIVRRINPAALLRVEG
ncbi:MAG: FtsX-like permease family protein, partial [Demequinaceae bacterium]|nr:FtsX-like permease family protein [Demequinaceae bacterium]